MNLENTEERSHFNPQHYQRDRTLATVINSLKCQANPISAILFF
ncbi:hypothetical protein [Nostoc sp. FACHB-280]|nr:hypothetical protein [Nostoc sp. FACHB-280]